MPNKNAYVDNTGGNRKVWGSTQLATAITAVSDKKVGYLKASKKFRIPKATAFRLANNNKKKKI